MINSDRRSGRYDWFPQGTGIVRLPGATLVDKGGSNNPLKAVHEGCSLRPSNLLLVSRFLSIFLRCRDGEAG